VKKNEAFDLDIVKYEEAYQTENYLSDEYAQRFKYPFRSLMFCPRAKVTSTCTCLVSLALNLIILSVIEGLQMRNQLRRLSMAGFVTHNVSRQAPPPKWNMPKHAQHQMSSP
jgi:hypothetical protein